VKRKYQLLSTDQIPGAGETKNACRTSAFVRSNRFTRVIESPGDFRDNQGDNNADNIVQQVGVERHKKTGEHE
jgi:hypothetical protein